MFRPWHALVFLLAFLGFAVALAPAGLVAAAIGPRAQLEAPSGTVWDGRAQSLRVGGLAAEGVRWRIKPLTVLTGALTGVGASVGGDIVGEVEADLGPDGRLRLRSPSLVLTKLPLPFPAATTGETRLEGLALDLSEGRCAAAAGVVRSDMLVALGPWRGPPLAGGVRCDGETTVLEASGVQGGEDVRLALRLAPNGAGLWRIEVRSASPATLGVLAGAGFAADPGGGGAKWEREFAWSAAGS